MKKLITTLIVGNGKGDGFSKKIWDICIPVMKNYAAKVGADFKILSKESDKFNGTSFFMQKLTMWEELQEYDRVLCLDADMLITSLAPDVLETFDAADTFYGLDSSYTDRARIILPYVDKYKLDWPTGSYGNPRQYNGGFWLLGNKLNLEYNVSEYISCKGYEENFVNYVLVKNKCKTQDVGIKWNKLCCDKTIDRRQCYIIHHGGWGFAPNWKELSAIGAHELWESKYQCCKEDYDYFYGSK